MSYWIELQVDGKMVELQQSHTLRGGTYALGGTTEATLNITYNYWKYFHKVFGENGIRGLYGRNVADGITWLMGGLRQLEGVPDDNYWAATEGNAKKAIEDLITLGGLVLGEGHFNAVWAGD